MGWRWGYASHHILAYSFIMGLRLKLWLCFYFAEQKGSITEWMGGEPEETEILEEKCIPKRGTRPITTDTCDIITSMTAGTPDTQHTALGKQNPILFLHRCTWIFVCICMHLCIYWFVYSTTISVFVCRHIELSICSTKAAHTSAKHDSHISDSASRYKLF